MFRAAFSRCPLDGSRLQTLSGDPLAGQPFADRYVIEACIGEGAMGRVYRARHKRVSRLFAIKVLFGDHAADAKMRSRFAREAEAASRLSHPNLISVIDFGETEESLLYLVMDFVRGRSLGEVIGQEAPLEERRIIALTKQLCRGLDHAHKRGLIHRDFKAENVLITSESGEETAKIVDFGIAMMLESARSSKLTTDGMVMGTPAFMSPEQATGDELDRRTDLYSLGVLIYYMLSGVLPFEGTPLEVARQQLTTAPLPISERVPGLEVDHDLEDIALVLMAKKREERFQDAVEVIRALDSIRSMDSATIVQLGLPPGMIDSLAGESQSTAVGTQSLEQPPTSHPAAWAETSSVTARRPSEPGWDDASEVSSSGAGNLRSPFVWAETEPAADTGAARASTGGHLAGHAGMTVRAPIQRRVPRFAVGGIVAAVLAGIIGLSRSGSETKLGTALMRSSEEATAAQARDRETEPVTPPAEGPQGVAPSAGDLRTGSDVAPAKPVDEEPAGASRAADQDGSEDSRPDGKADVEDIDLEPDYLEKDEPPRTAVKNVKKNRQRPRVSRKRAQAKKPTPARAKTPTTMKDLQVMLREIDRGVKELKRAGKVDDARYIEQRAASVRFSGCIREQSACEHAYTRFLGIRRALRKRLAD